MITWVKRDNKWHVSVTVEEKKKGEGMVGEVTLTLHRKTHRFQSACDYEARPTTFYWNEFSENKV